jgi:hypothetical protein
MCLNGCLQMTAFRNRLLGLAAGTLALSSFSSMAYAQGPEEVFDFSASPLQLVGGAGRSTFTFGSSLILNSIGFVYDSSIADADYTFAYWIGDVNTVPTFLTVAQTRLDSTGLIRYYDLPNPTTYAAGTEVAVVTDSSSGTSARTGFTDNAVGVTHINEAGSTFAAGNLRVTALGGSIAPEPGSFALALTGGAALIGVCVRRRRNAA